MAPSPSPRDLLPADTMDAAGWRQRRAAIRRWWLDYLKPLRIAVPPARYEVLAEDRDAGVLRQRIRYLNEPGISLEAYLLTPFAATPGGHAGVVALHSTHDDTIRQGAGLGSMPSHAFGVDLAQRGCVVICPCNMLWTGTQQKDLDFDAASDEVMARYGDTTGMAKMLFDAQRAVDLLESVPAVDPRRIGCAGHSLGGKEALYLAAFDERIAAAVSSEGGIGLAQCNWDALRYLGPACRRPDFGHDHHEVLALVAPRPFLLLGGDSADGAASQAYIDAVKPVYRLHGVPERLDFLNHHQGHAIPPEAKERLVAWLVEHLGA